MSTTIASPESLSTVPQQSNSCVTIPVNSHEQLPAKGSPAKDAQTTFACDQCSYSSHNKNYLKQHVNLVHVHDASRPYQCSYCNFAAKRNQALQDHLLVHSDERPFQCTQCNATFRKKGHLTSHLKMHSYQRMFECTICKDQYPKRLDLYTHLRLSHPSDNIFDCTICEYATTIKSNIIMHMNTHSNPMVYKCTHCDFTAVHVNLLNQHLKGHDLDPRVAPVIQTINAKPAAMATSNIIQLQCSECGFKTYQQEVFKGHMMEHMIGQGHMDDLSNQNSASHVQTSKNQVLTNDESSSAKLFSSNQTVPNAQGGVVNKDNKWPQTLYKCSDCAYTDPDTTSFIKHMLQHDATQKNSKSKQTNLGLQGCTTVQQTGVGFTHDAAFGFYKCTICGYTCEHQRTIKAHIWKHSGHKEIEYPMFRNGPLSIYDDTPITTESYSTKKSTKGVTIVKIYDQGKMSETTHKTTPAPYSPGPACLSAKNISIASGSSWSQKDVNTAPVVTSTVTPNLVQLLRSDSHRKQAIQQGSNDQGMVTSTHDSNQMTTVTILKDANESKKRAKETILSPVLHSTIRKQLCAPSTSQYQESNTDTSSSAGTSEITEASSKADVLVETISNTVPLPPISSFSSENRSPSVHVTYNMENQPGTHVVPEAEIVNSFSVPQIGSEHEISTAVEKDSTVSMETTSQNSDDTVPSLKRKVETEYVGFAKRRCDEDSSANVVVKTVTEDYAVPTMFLDSALNCPQNDRPMSVESTNSVKSRVFAELQPIYSPISSVSDNSKTSNEKMVVPSSEFKPGVSTNTLASTSEEIPTCISEEVTLLSLLKKGPNFNPAYPSELQKIDQVVLSPTPAAKQSKSVDKLHNDVAMDDGISETSASSNEKPKSGICSSLLAVIEQLRERSKSDSDHDVTTEDSNVVQRVDRSRSRKGRTRLSMETSCEMDDDKVEKIEGTNRCKLCHYTSASMSLIRSHMKMHKIKQPKECSLCSYVAETNEDLQEHVLQHCKIRTYQCKACPANFSYKSQLRAHMRAHGYEKARETICYCDMCSYETTVYSSYVSHMESHAKDKEKRHEFSCLKCDVEFTTEVDLASHTMQCLGHVETSATCCQKCMEEFPTSNDLLVHRRKCLNKEIHPCLKCLREFDTSATLADHQKTCLYKNASADVFPCPKCKTSFNTSNKLFKHIDSCESHIRWTCDECGYATNFKAEYIAHARKHAKVYQCDRCMFVSLTQNALTKHVLTHMDRPLHCELCEFSAMSTRSLKSHMKRHVNDQRFVQQPLEQYRCNLCGYLCHHLPSLKSHMWRHAADSKYNFQNANNAINAAIDYETKMCGQMVIEGELEDLSPDGSSGGEELPMVVSSSNDGGGTLVTFRCCQCGFECTHKKVLHDHMKTHADIIKTTLDISGSRPPDSTVPLEVAGSRSNGLKSDSLKDSI